MTINQARRLQKMTRWHRRLAVFIMAWLVLLATTGLLINHANDWGLDSKPLPGAIQQWVYGVAVDGRDYCGTFPSTGTECSGIFADLELPEGRLLLAEYSLFLIDVSGRLVEKLPVSHTGLDTLGAGVALGAAVYLRDASRTVRTDPDLVEFRLLNTDEMAAVSQAAWQVRDVQHAGITWERLLLDLHAARFLGPWAKAFNDVAAGLILLLAASGGWLYRLRRKGGEN